jgi:hypothetical protein
MALADTLKLPKTAALLGGQGLPKTPKGYVGLAEKAPVEAELTEAQVKAEKDIGMADVGIERAKQEQKIQDLEGQQVLAQKAAQDIRALPEREALKGKREEFAGMTFAPTKDNAQDLAGLFSLVNVIGMAVGGGGKQNAQQAMYAMNGMLEGYQKGRADLYRKEKESFDKNFKAMQESVKTLEKDYEEAVKMYQYDKEAGEIARKLALARSGSPLFKAMEDRVGMIGTLNAIKELRSSVDKGVTLQNNLQGKADTKALQEANLLLRQANAENKAARSPAAKAQGQNALTFASRQYGNIANAVQDLKNMQMLPATSQSPVFAGMIGVDPNTALSSISALAARTITSKEEKAFEQITNSLDAALSRLEAQGLASGATKAAIQSFNSLKPRKGDSAINMALYIARVKQEIQTGIDVHSEMPGATPGQKEKAKAMLSEINTVVPFDVDAVLDTLRKNRKTLDSKMQGLLKTPTISSGIQMPKDLPPEPAVSSAAPAPMSSKQRAQPGEQVFTDAAGNKAVKRNEQWVEVE